MKHILFTLKCCKKELLDDEGFVKEVVYMAAHKCRSTLISLDSYKFDPQGVTCVAMLAESHISIHTWPEKVWQSATSLRAVNILNLKMV